MRPFKPRRSLRFFIGTKFFFHLINVPILSGNRQDNYSDVYKISKTVVIITIGAMQAFTIKFSPFSDLIYFNTRGVLLHFSEP